MARSLTFTYEQRQALMTLAHRRVLPATIWPRFDRGWLEAEVTGSPQAMRATVERAAADLGLGAPQVVHGTDGDRYVAAGPGIRVWGHLDATAGGGVR